jgi:uncharacterized OB-fold protein
VTDAVSDAPVRTRFEPPVGPDSGPFWEATRQGRFLLQWCTACERAVFYPRAFCPHCGGGTGGLEWREASGRGTVYAAGVEHRPQAVGATFSGGQPFSVALIELDEGVRLVSNVVGCPPEEVRCGMAVALTWEPLSDGRQLPLFTTPGAAGAPREGGGA